MTKFIKVAAGHYTGIVNGVIVTVLRYMAKKNGARLGYFWSWSAGLQRDAGYGTMAEAKATAIRSLEAR